MSVVGGFSISYLVPKISIEPKHDPQNWFNANSNKSQDCDVIGFACCSVSFKINYNSVSANSNPLKLCEQKVTRKVQSILVEC